MKITLLYYYNDPSDPPCVASHSIHVRNGDVIELLCMPDNAREITFIFEGIEVHCNSKAEAIQSFKTLLHEHYPNDWIE